MITYYSIVNRLVEDYFNSDGFTKESKLLSAFYLINLIGKPSANELQSYEEIKNLLQLSIKNFKNNSKNIAEYYLKLASKKNEENLSIITRKLGELDPSVREAMVSNVNFDFKIGYIGVVEDW